MAVPQYTRRAVLASEAASAKAARVHYVSPPYNPPQRTLWCETDAPVVAPVGLTTIWPVLRGPQRAGSSGAAPPPAAG